MKTIRIAAISIITSCLPLQAEPVYKLRPPTSAPHTDSNFDFGAAVALSGDYANQEII